MAFPWESETPPSDNESKGCLIIALIFIIFSLGKCALT